MNDEGWVAQLDPKYARLLIEDPRDSENSLTMAIGGDGRLMITVSEEQADDSYKSVVQMRD